jgi:hypothetical protein
MTTLPLAHERWFHEPVKADWSFAGEARTLAYLAAAVGLMLLIRLIARRWPGVDVPLLARLAPWMPFAVRIHLAVSLIGLLSLGYWLAPSMDLESNPVGIALGATMVVVAVSMATGRHARAGAVLLIATGPAGMLEFGFWDVVQRLDMLGMALFVLIAGPGRWSADHELGEARDPAPFDTARAVWALRVAAGAALIAVAFAEKLANPDLALSFLADHPNLNVADALGIPLSDLEFIRIAGGVEVFFGLVLISGALPQACVLIAAIPFNATLWFFGSTELMGHLPIYGTLLVLLVYGSDPGLRPSVSALWPWRSPSNSDTLAAKVHTTNAATGA